MLGDSLVSTDVKVIGSDEVIKVVSNDSKFIVTILVSVYGITIGLDFVTDMGYLDVFFDGSNDSNIEGLFIGGLIGIY